MSIRRELINNLYDEAYSLIHDDDISKRFFSLVKYISNNNLLTNDEKSIVIKRYNADCDYFKVLFNKGRCKKCEICNENRLATFYCEYCIRKYLESIFPSWSSGNNDVDNLIKNYQMNSITPHMIIEWIPYENLENIEISAKGGSSDIYSAIWKNGHYNEWDFLEKKIKRVGPCKVILKYLEDDEIANRTWFEEV